jgi:hypothetical protein
MDPSFLQGSRESYWLCSTHVATPANGGSSGGGSLMDFIRANIGSNTERDRYIADHAAKRVTLPRGSSCGPSRVTSSYRVQYCPTGVMCAAQIPPPRGCERTGLWYDTDTAELCCPVVANPPAPSISEPGSGDAAILAEMQRRRAMEQAALAQQQTSRHNTLLLLGLGAIGIGLIMVLRRK